MCKISSFRKKFWCIYSKNVLMSYTAKIMLHGDLKAQ